MARQRILIVEDDEEIQELVEYNLAKAGFDVTRTATGDQAIDAARRARHDLVLLDLILPGLGGLGVCLALRSDPRTQSVGIIILTAKSGDDDIVAGLEAGADDYVTKPFSPRVLLGRVQAVLRRRAKVVVAESAVVVRENLKVDPSRHAVLVDDRPVSLTPAQFKIVHMFARRPGWVFTRSQVRSALEGDAAATNRAVDVQVLKIRQKLGPAAHLVETVRGVGYRFKED